MNIYEFLENPSFPLNIYSLIIFIILFILIIFYIYVKLTFKFWSIQPVFHAYNIYYWMFPPGIINKELPEINKYVNFNNIFFQDMATINVNKIKNITTLIQDHYLKQKNVHYNPSTENIMPYFKGHDYPCFLSSYFEKDHLNKKEIIGLMTSRPLNIYLYRKEMCVYYVDYLCVNTGYRKRGIAPELIQTHNYFQCRGNKKIRCSLFKKETDLTGIVPLTIYKTYCFDMNNWKQNFKLHSSIQTIQITNKNSYLLYDLLNKISKSDKFSCVIVPSMANILSLLESNNIYVYLGFKKDKILSAYFFRDSSLKYDNENVIECFCTINNGISNDLFVYIFSNAVKDLLKDRKEIRYLLLENNSDTKEILVNIMLKYEPLFDSPCAYYLYNFGIRPIEESKICIIN